MICVQPSLAVPFNTQEFKLLTSRALQPCAVKCKHIMLKKIKVTKIMADLHLICKQCPQLIWSSRKPAKSLVDNGGRLSLEHLMGRKGRGDYVWAGMLHKTKSLLMSSLGMVCLTLAAT